MTAYVDASVILSDVLRERSPQEIALWKGQGEVYASRILQVEVLRKIDRMRHTQYSSDEDIANMVQAFLMMMKGVGEIPISEAVLNRASQPFPTAVGSLDAIHLSTAILLQEEKEEPILFFTFDRQLGIAARAVGLQAEGFD